MDLMLITAIALAVLSIWGFLIVGGVARSQLSPITLWLSAILTTLLVIARPRVISYGIKTIYAASFSDTPRKVAVALLVLWCVVLCLHWLKQWSPPNSVIWKGLVIYTGFTLIAIPMATEPKFFWGFLLAPLVMSTITLYGTKQLERHVILILRLLVYGSLVSLAIAPSWASAEYNAGFLPFRLYGLSPDAIGLATLAMISFIIEPAGRFQLVHKLAALAVLVLSQGKAAMVGLFVSYLVLLAHERKHKLIIGILLIPALFALTNIVGEGLSQSTSVLQENIPTLSGRLPVWEETLETWSDNPLFGYGPTIWLPDFRPSTLGWAGQAHNQFLQTLGQSGLFGLAGLLVYIGTLIWTVRRSSRGLSLLTGFLITLLGNASLSSITLDMNGLQHYLVFSYCVGITLAKDATGKGEHRVPHDGQRSRQSSPLRLASSSS